jgi:hypothetical protein
MFGGDMPSLAELSAQFAEEEEVGDSLGAASSTSQEKEDARAAAHARLTGGGESRIQSTAKPKTGIARSQSLRKPEYASIRKESNNKHRAVCKTTIYPRRDKEDSIKTRIIRLYSIHEISNRSNSTTYQIPSTNKWNSSSPDSNNHNNEAYTHAKRPANCICGTRHK